MADKGNTGAKVALRLLEDPSKLLSTVQIGITAIGVFNGIVGEAAFAEDVADHFPGTRDKKDDVAFFDVERADDVGLFGVGEELPEG